MCTLSPVLSRDFLSCVYLYIYVAVGKDVTNNDAPLFIMSKDYNIKDGQTQISLTG